MRNSSSKKQRLQPQLSHKIQSKLLITSSSKHIDALSKNILSKFDLLKNEQQLNREYKLKFQSQRKGKSSRKSSSKDRVNNTSKEKTGRSNIHNSHSTTARRLVFQMAAHHPIPMVTPSQSQFQPQQSQYNPRNSQYNPVLSQYNPQPPILSTQPSQQILDGQYYHNKYLQLHDSYLQQKQTWLQLTQSHIQLKDCLGDYLSRPSDRNYAQKLKNVIKNQKTKQAINRHYQTVIQLQRIQLVMNEVMGILQVGRVQDVASSLRVRVDRYRNLDQCTFRILQLQSINKRLVVDFQQRLRSARRQAQDSYKQQMEEFSLEQARSVNSMRDMQQQLNKQKQQHKLLLNDISRVIGQIGGQKVQWKSSCIVVQQLKRSIRDLQQRLQSAQQQVQEIEVEAQQNRFKIMSSNKQIVKLQSLMGELKDQLQRQIQEEQLQNQQNITQINRLLTQIQQLKQQISTKQQQNKQTKTQHHKQLLLIASTLQAQQPHSAHIVLHAQQLQLQLTQLTHNITKLEKQLDQARQNIYIGQRALAQLSQQTRQDRTNHQKIKQASEKALYQKQQYKFLLNNLRDQVTIMKQQHNDQKNQIIRKKDREIIQSNKDILTSHEQLQQQYSQIRTQMATIRIQYDQNKIQLNFVKQQLQHTQTSLNQKSTQLQKCQQENQRYKTYLQEIQSSFKEVVDLEEQSGRKNRDLQGQLQDAKGQIYHLTARVKQLQTSNKQVTQNRNQLKTQLQICLADIKSIRQQRVRLQSSNVQLRLQLISRRSDIDRLEQQQQRISRQGQSHKQHNQQLNYQINSVTKQLLVSRMQFKSRIENKIMGCFEGVLKVEQEQKLLGNTVTKELGEMYLFMQNSVIKLFQMCLRKGKKVQETAVQTSMLSVSKQETAVQTMVRKVQIQQSAVQTVTISEEDRELLTFSDSASQLKIEQTKRQDQNQNKIEFQQKAVQSSLQAVQQYTQTKNIDIKQKQIQCTTQPKQAQTQYIEPQQKRHRTVSQQSVVQVQVSILSHQSESKSYFKKQSVKVQMVDKSVNCYHNALFYVQLQQVSHQISQLQQVRMDLLDQIHNLKVFVKQNLTSIAQHMAAFKQQPVQSQDLQKAIIMQEYQQSGSSQQPVSNRQHQAQTVNQVLQTLLDNQGQIPSLPYWATIQANFLALRKKLTKKGASLKLDLSAIDCRDPVQSSPQSNFFPDSDYFKRSVTQSDQVVQVRQPVRVGMRVTQAMRDCRSQRRSCDGQSLKHQNEDLREKIQLLVGDHRRTILVNSTLQARVQQLQIQLQQLRVELVSLQNETSIKGIQNNFKKMLDYMLNQQMQLFEQTCRVLMKMLHFSGNDIKDYQEKIDSKKKKKKGGLLASLFKT